MLEDLVVIETGKSNLFGIDVSVGGPGTIVLGVVFRICTITGSPNRGVCSFVMNQEQHRYLL